MHAASIGSAARTCRSPKVYQFVGVQQFELVEKVEQRSSLMNELKYSTIVLMLLIDSSTGQSEFIKACAKKLFPLLMQRVVVEWLFGSVN